MDHIFVVILSIFMMDIYLLDHIRITISYNCGTLEHVNQSKIFLGMKAFHQRNHAKFMDLNSKRQLVTWLLLEAVYKVVSVKQKYLMETKCSNHAPKSRISAELSFLLTLVTVVIHLHLEVVMVSSESSILSMRSEWTNYNIFISFLK